MRSESKLNQLKRSLTIRSKALHVPLVTRIGESCVFRYLREVQTHITKCTKKHNVNGRFIIRYNNIDSL